MGALGPVFRAQGTVPGQLVAVKAFKLDVSPELAPSIADGLRQLVTGTPMLVGLVPLVDAALEGETPWLAMDHVACPTLDTKLREGGLLPLDEAIALVRALAQAVDTAHAHGLRHGSFHPRDVFLPPEGGVIVNGFGVAAALGVAGLRPPRRRPFTAPETLAQKPLDAPADRYALGVMAYEIVSGRRLLGAGDDLAAGLASRADTSDVPRAATALKAMLAERPDHRPSSAAAFAQAFCTALEVSPSPATAVTLTPSPRPTPHPAAPLLAVIPPASSRPVHIANDPPPAEALAEFARQGTFWEPPRTAEDADATTLVSPSTRPGPTDDVSTGPVVPLGLAPPIEAPEVGAADRAPALEDPLLRVDAPVRESSGDTLLFRSFGDAPERPAAAEPPAADLAAHTPPLVVLALTLGLGLAVGAAGGYLVGVRSGERAAQRALGGDTMGPAGFTDAAAPSPAAPAGPVATPDIPASAPAPPADAGRPAAATPESPAVSRTPRPAPAPLGQLAVRSTPSRAGVIVDGTWRGRTPLTVKGLTPGTHAVRVVEDGYIAETRRVAVDARSTPTTVSFQLARVRAADKAGAGPAKPGATTGRLLVESRPSGAAVFVDGRVVGTTPLLLSDLPPGLRQIRLELAGHQPWEKTETIVAGQRVRVAASLEESR